MDRPSKGSSVWWSQMHPEFGAFCLLQVQAQHMDKVWTSRDKSISIHWKTKFPWKCVCEGRQALHFTALWTALKPLDWLELCISIHSAHVCLTLVRLSSTPLSDLFPLVCCFCDHLRFETLGFTLNGSVPEFSVLLKINGMLYLHVTECPRISPSSQLAL